jgi:hypothetical protein
VIQIGAGVRELTFVQSEGRRNKKFQQESGGQAGKHKQLSQQGQVRHATFQVVGRARFVLLEVRLASPLALLTLVVYLSCSLAREMEEN